MSDDCGTATDEDTAHGVDGSMSDDCGTATDEDMLMVPQTPTKSSLHSSSNDLNSTGSGWRRIKW